MMPFITAGLILGSAGVPPVVSLGVNSHKITGETPALPKLLPGTSSDCAASGE